VVLISRALTPIELAYLPAIKALCEEHGAMLVFMRLPLATSQEPIEISNQVLALGAPIIAASPESMFGNVSSERIKENYFDPLHLNSNGARRSAQVFGPALQTLLDQIRG
jgi:hypothetical protein